MTSSHATGSSDTISIIISKVGKCVNQNKRYQVTDHGDTFISEATPYYQFAQFRRMNVRSHVMFHWVTRIVHILPKIDHGMRRAVMCRRHY